MMMSEKPCSKSIPRAQKRVAGSPLRLARARSDDEALLSAAAAEEEEGVDRKGAEEGEKTEEADAADAGEGGEKTEGGVFLQKIR